LFVVSESQLDDLPLAGFIPGDPTSFVAQLSEKLAAFAPQLTLDFIHEVSAAMTSKEGSAIAHQISCLSYMSPWIQNLSHFANVTHALYERSGARLRDCIRTLAGLSLSSPQVLKELCIS
jgi:neurofibromin 1